jgi:hypothetical protein
MADASRPPESHNLEPDQAEGFILDADEYQFVFEEMRQKDDKLYPALHDQELVKLITAPHYHRIVHSYYFQSRNSLVLIPPDFGRRVDPQFIERRDRLRMMAAHQAEYLASRHLARNEVIAPFWYTTVDENLSGHPNPAVAAAWTAANKTLDQEPTIRPRTVLKPGGYEIVISVLTRTFLKSIVARFTNLRNMFDFGMSDAVDLEEEKREAISYYFAHCWFVCNDFHPLCIPACGYVGRYSFILATRIAFLQTVFVLLHEIGHIALGHGRADGGAAGGDPRHAARPAIARLIGGVQVVAPVSADDACEAEADRFAFENLLALNLYEPDLNLFAALSVLDYLRMFEATATLEPRSATDPELSDVERSSSWLARSMGQATKRRELFRRDFGGSWKSETEKNAYSLFAGYADAYIQWTPGLTQQEIDELTGRRDYLIRR